LKKASSTIVFSREYAKDVLAFAIALCDYIYVLAEKYKEFIERKARKLKRKRKAAIKSDEDCAH
jgi:hypothetical protein